MMKNCLFLKWNYMELMRGIYMFKIIPGILILSVSCFALNNFTYYHTWHQGDSVTYLKLQANNDSIKNKMGQVIDTQNRAVVHFNPNNVSHDSVVKYIRIDTIRSNPHIDSLHGYPKVDSIAAQKFVGPVTGNVTGNVTGATLVSTTTLSADSGYFLNGINTGSTSFFGHARDAYFNGNTLNFYGSANADDAGYINYTGYNLASSRYRSLGIMNGKGSVMAWFDGPTSRFSIGSSTGTPARKFTVNGGATIDTMTVTTNLSVDSLVSTKKINGNLSGTADSAKGAHHLSGGSILPDSVNCHGLIINKSGHFSSSVQINTGGELYATTIGGTRVQLATKVGINTGVPPTAACEISGKTTMDTLNVGAGSDINNLTVIDGASDTLTIRVGTKTWKFLPIANQ
jgi:hypothetical protein